MKYLRDILELRAIFTTEIFVMSTVPLQKFHMLVFLVVLIMIVIIIELNVRVIPENVVAVEQIAQENSYFVAVVLVTG